MCLGMEPMDLVKSHDCSVESKKFLPCKQLGHIISDHLISWTVLNPNFLVLDQICNEKIFDVEVTSSFSSTRLSIFFEFHRALIVSEHDVVLDLVSLCL